MGYISNFLLLCMLQIIYTGWASEWSYSGLHGPHHWKHMPGNEECGGDSQSPVNIQRQDLICKEYNNKLNFVGYDSKKLQMKLKNNGHSAQVDILGGYASISRAGLRAIYKLVQFHFHWGNDSTRGSEHNYNGVPFPAEMHLVHYNTKYRNIDVAANKPDGLAVLAVFLDVGASDNLAYDDIIHNLRNVIYKDESTKIPTINLMSLLPRNTDEFFRYKGSLTTPPCYESVTWTVFYKPVKLSELQFEQFRSLMNEEEGNQDSAPLVNNFRPVQPLNCRRIKANVRSLGRLRARRRTRLSL